MPLANVGLPASAGPPLPPSLRLPSNPLELKASALLQSLERATRNHPLDRKILVCPTKQQGRELLRALSVSGTAWLGWEVATPWLLALELVHDAVRARKHVIA